MSLVLTAKNTAEASIQLTSLQTTGAKTGANTLRYPSTKLKEFTTNIKEHVPNHVIIRTKEIKMSTNFKYLGKEPRTVSFCCCS